MKDPRLVRVRRTAIWPQVERFHANGIGFAVWEHVMREDAETHRVGPVLCENCLSAVDELGRCVTCGFDAGG